MSDAFGDCRDGALLFIAEAIAAERAVTVAAERVGLERKVGLCVMAERRRIRGAVEAAFARAFPFGVGPEALVALIAAIESGKDT